MEVFVFSTATVSVNTGFPHRSNTLEVELPVDTNVFPQRRLSAYVGEQIRIANKITAMIIFNFISAPSLLFGFGKSI